MYMNFREFFTPNKNKALLFLVILVLAFLVYLASSAISERYWGCGEGRYGLSCGSSEQPTTEAVVLVTVGGIVYGFFTLTAEIEKILFGYYLGIASYLILLIYYYVLASALSYKIKVAK